MKLGNKIELAEVVSADEFKVRLKFIKGKSGVISLKHLFEKPSGLVAEILRGGMFEMLFVESGALAWPNGFELCPDALLMWMDEQAKSKNSSAA